MAGLGGCRKVRKSPDGAEALNYAYVPLYFAVAALLYDVGIDEAMVHLRHAEEARAPAPASSMIIARANRGCYSAKPSK